MAAGNKKARHLWQEVTSRCVQFSTLNGPDSFMLARANQYHANGVTIARTGQ